MIANFSATSPWILIPRPNPHAHMRLICFPHAGAGASSFASWAPILEASQIEMRTVQYPGRETRLNEPFIQDASMMVQALADWWTSAAGSGPCAFYGHSMGAILAFELALELQRREARQRPIQLFLSGRNPPHVPSNLPPIHTLADNAFLDAIGDRYGRLPAELRAHKGALAVIVPILRADFTLVSSYTWVDFDRVEAPITVLGGTSDPWTTEEQLSGWQQHTRRSTEVHIIPGDHFFHQNNRDIVLQIVRQVLTTASHLGSSS